MINFINIKKINSRGIAKANKHLLMAALTYNFKKLMKFERKKVLPMVLEKSKIWEVQQKFKIGFFDLQ